LLAVFIACLGLFGLASYTAEQRTKEIGVRKVLGASLGNIVLLLSKEFALLVAVATLLSWPLAYFAMRLWLQEFAYRININHQILTFLLAAVLAFAIALITVSFQSIKAAMTNPVEALRYE
jgi:putative ABC transport system permease protein